MFSAATKSGKQVAANYIEDVFSTYLYTGNGSTQTITNNINLSTYGGLVWIKSRTNAYNNNLFDTAQGATKLLHSNTTDLQTTDANSLTAFTASGFTLGSGNTAGNQVNTSTDNFVSWTFRKQAKFFDVVTYTGTGANRTIAHNLGSVPGCIMIKRLTASANNWRVYHQSLGAGTIVQLNLTNIATASATSFNSTAPTSTVFTVGTDVATNASGSTYVAYLFADNAGGFGNAGTDNVISCGSFTPDGSGNVTVNLGYEPQWVLFKEAYNTNDWWIVDTLRGMPVVSGGVQLQPNTALSESSQVNKLAPTSTGFASIPGYPLSASSTYIYIAIRRGPMKTPTSGTSVFYPRGATSDGNNGITTTGMDYADAVLLRSYYQDSGGVAVAGSNYFYDRLRGGGYGIATNASSAESLNPAPVNVTAFSPDKNNRIGLTVVGSGQTTMPWLFKRAPGFFDEVCYSGSGTDGRTVNHNLGVSPELIIIKSRTSSPADYGWVVSSSYLTGGITTLGRILYLNTTAAQTQQGWVHTATSTTFKVEGANQVNSSLSTYVAYLFASCPSVSKVGSYTGTGATQTISCGFTGGARFVLIKRTDSTGDWYVWDTARGMVSGTDPSLLLNSTAAEVNANSVYTTAGGFQIVSTAAGINASGGSYIFLAIA